jgi:hypothetical protein
MIQAWHFVGDTLGDGRPVPADGEWLVHDGPVVMCESGLLASVDVWDALQYAPGPVLCRVEMDGVVLEGADKIVASRRRIVERVDLTDDLRGFACDEALRVAHLWDMPDVVRDYLTTRDDSLREAARDAARAAWSAADSAADAARAAGRAAELAVTRAAAAWAAVSAAARGAERAAARVAGWASDASTWAAGEWDAAAWAAWASDAATWAAGEWDKADAAKPADRFRSMVRQRFAWPKEQA